MGRNVGDVNNYYKGFIYNNVPGARFGPDPGQMQEFLQRDPAFSGIGVIATRVGRWDEFAAHLEFHVGR